MEEGRTPVVGRPNARRVEATGAGKMTPGQEDDNLAALPQFL
ncbi:hypothetical protein SBA2_250032 [Acidobacteriia bacterium SbA2]|nr:hypothetical protein SBA2_250032 [Acidobacteriia bacterium SbA2]